MRAAPLVVVACALLLSACENPVAPNPIDPACSALRASIPYSYSMPTFSDPNATSQTIPWCMSAGADHVVLSINVPVIRAGDVKLTLADIRPSTKFALSVLTKGCDTPQSGPARVFGLGTDTDWTIPLPSGDYCFQLSKGNPELEVWVTLVLQRP